MARIRTVHRIVANDNKLDILGIMFSARKVSLVKLNDLTIFGHVCVCSLTPANMVLVTVGGLVLGLPHDIDKIDKDICTYVCVSVINYTAV